MAPPLNRLCRLAALLTLAALPACTCADQAGALHFACTSTADCADDFVCRGGECRSINSPPGGCLATDKARACAIAGCQQTCGVDGGFGACVPVSGPDFSSNPLHCGECGRSCSQRLGTSLTCIDSRCTCAVDSDCPAGTSCAAGGVCLIDTDPCVNIDCPSGQVCRLGTCAVEQCSDGCAVGEVCDTGTCRPIHPCRFPAACGDGGICEGAPKADGEKCDDRAACSFNDVCVSGACSGTAYSCGTPNACQLSVACAGDGGCTSVSRPDGTPCDDGVTCTASDSCTAGQCAGAAYTCTAAACEATSVCAGDGGCLVTNKAAGAACDDGNLCSRGDFCDAGSCSGIGYTCPAPTACQQQVACAGDGGCIVTNKAAGDTCNDGQACTTMDTCSATQVCAGVAATTYLDNDGDGKGNSNIPQSICPTDGGWVLIGGDCNDNDSDVSQVQNGLVSDLDQDGYTTGAAALECVGTSQVVNGRTYYKDTSGNFTWLLATDSLGTDCLNTDPDVFTSMASMGTDADNDGTYVGTAATACVGASQLINGRTYFKNAAGAFVLIASSAALGGNECNDADTDVYRTVANVGADADQDGFIALAPAIGSQCVGDTSVVSGRTYYRNAAGTYSWLVSPGLGSDCNDADNAVSGPFPWYVDGDGDTFGAGAGTVACASPGPTYVTNNSDCLDTDLDVFQTVAALVADADQDAYAGTGSASQCVGSTTTVGGRTYYKAANALFTWMPAASSLGADCLDSDLDVFTSLASSATDVDNDGFYVGSLATNCVGTSSVISGRTYYRDAAGALTFIAAGSLGGGDCLDSDLDVYQTVANLGADVDQDGYIPVVPAVGSQCVGNTSVVSGRTYYRNATGTYSWLTAPGLGSDCNDVSAGTFGPFPWYFDSDGDGFGTGASTISCASPGAGYVINNTDCLDSNNLIYQTVASLQTDADQDAYTVGAASSQCVGNTQTVALRTYFRNSIGGYTLLASTSSLGTDCNDASAAVLGAPSWYQDLDGDLRGAGAAVVQCTSPGGTYVSNGTDCNDLNGLIYQSIASLLPDTDQDGYTTGAAATQCVGNTTLVAGRTYYRASGGLYSWLPSASSLGTDCNANDKDVFVDQNNLLQDFDNDGYPYPNDTTVTVCVGNPITISGRNYYVGTSGTADWMSKNDCIGRSGNTCPFIDCYDLNANARIGQTVYFTVNRGDGSFDYNCSGGTVENTPTSGTYCSSASSTDFYSDATCLTSTGTASQCVTPTAYVSGNATACGKNVQGTSGYYNPLACTFGYRVSGGFIGCR